LPVIAFSEYFIYDTFKPENIIIPLLVTFGLSVISWRYVEQPFRLRKQPPGNHKKVFLYTACFSACLAGICFVTTMNAGFPSRSRQNRLLEEIRTDREKSDLKLWSYNTRTIKPDSLKRLATVGNVHTIPEFILWGESHAGKLLPVFEAACLEKNKSGYVAITLNAPPTLSTRMNLKRPNLPKMNWAIVRFIAAHPEIKKVFLTARWNVYRNQSLNNSKRPDQKNSAMDCPFDEELIRTIDTLTKINKEVIILAPMPELNTIPKKYFFQSIFLHKDINSLTPTKEQFLSDNKGTLDLMARFVGLPNVHVLLTYEFFFRNGKMILFEQDHLMFIDKHHLSQWGALKLKNVILGELQ
jgi:hypothetical protein